MKKKKHLKACHFNGDRKNTNHCFARRIIPVEIVKLEDNSYHLVLPVEINGTQGHMILDTGASVTVVDKNILGQNELQPPGIQIQSGSVTGQIEDVKVFKTQSFKIGGASFKNTRIAAINLDYVNEMYVRHLKRKIIGLLGSDFCVKHSVVIDYRKKILICRK